MLFVHQSLTVHSRSKLVHVYLLLYDDTILGECGGAHGQCNTAGCPPIARHNAGKNYDKKYLSPTLIYLQWMDGVQKHGVVVCKLEL